MRVTIPTAILTLYIGGAVGMMIAAVGETYRAGVYSAWLPFNSFLMLLLPAILGYWIGWERRKQQQQQEERNTTP